MNRAEFQQLADVRIAEAAALLAAGLWDGAYYLAGYAVECALKACVLKLVEQTGIIFEDKKFAEKCWTHDLDLLAELVGIAGDVNSARGVPPVYPDVALRWNKDYRTKPERMKITHAAIWHQPR